MRTMPRCRGRTVHSSVHIEICGEGEVSTHREPLSTNSCSPSWYILQRREEIYFMPFEKEKQDPITYKTGHRGAHKNCTNTTVLRGHPGEYR